MVLENKLFDRVLDLNLASSHALDLSKTLFDSLCFE